MRLATVARFWLATASTWAQNPEQPSNQGILPLLKQKATCCLSPSPWYTNFVSVSKILIRCLLLRPAMPSNVGVANQTDVCRRKQVSAIS